MSVLGVTVFKEGLCMNLFELKGAKKLLSYLGANM